MVRIRLSRRGKKRQPLYRVVVADQKSKRDGRFIEHIGNYNPHTDPSTYNIDEARALYWLTVGAQPSDAVRRLLDKQGTMDRLKRFHAGEELDALVAEFTGAAVETVEEEAPAKPKKKSKKALAKEAEEKAAAEAAAAEAAAEEASAEAESAEAEESAEDAE